MGFLWELNFFTGAWTGFWSWERRAGSIPRETWIRV